MTKQGKKLLLHLSLAVLGVFLVIHYWATIATWFSDIYKAILPCIIGAVIAYLINILMRFYERHYFTKKNPPFAQKSRTAVCLICAILTILCVIVGIIVLIVPQLISCVKLIVQQAPKGVEALLKNDKIVQYLPESVYDWLANWREKLTDQAFWSDFVAKATAFLKTGLGSTGSKITSALTSTASTIGSVVIGIVFAIYYLACRGSIQRNVNRLAANYLKPTVREKLFHYASVFNDCFHKYIVAQCLEALILGSLCLVGMLAALRPNDQRFGLSDGAGPDRRRNDLRCDRHGDDPCRFSGPGRDLLRDADGRTGDRRQPDLPEGRRQIRRRPRPDRLCGGHCRRQHLRYPRHDGQRSRSDCGVQRTARRYDEPRTAKRRRAMRRRRNCI